MGITLKVGSWNVDPVTGYISKGSKKHRLEPKAMAVLVYLAENAGEIVSRVELEESIWKDSVVTYEALTVTINKIRAVFEDDSKKPLYIETLTKRGYRLIATVSKKESRPEYKFINQKNNLVIGLSLIIIFSVIVYVFYLSQTKKTLFIPENVPSIAVIPFSNNNLAQEQDYFAGGITEYLITDLSRLPNLIVTSRNSVLGLNSKTIDLDLVSKTLKAQYILTGSVLKNKKQIRIAVQLIEVATGVQVWADRFDRNEDDLFKVQDEIIKRIIAKLVEQVGLTDKEFRKRNYTANHAAHDYYIRGNALYTSISKEGNSLAREMFMKAIEIDSLFSSTYSAIALTYIDDYRRKWGEDPSGAVERAFEYANKAIAIDNTNAVAYVVLAYAQLYGRKDPERSIIAARQAIKLYPNYADAYAIIGSAYSFVGRSVDAIRINKHAIRLNPTSSYIYLSNLGRDNYFLKNKNKAIENLQDAIFRNENYLNAHLYLAATYASLDRVEDAQWEKEKVLILDPEFSLNYWSETQPYSSSHRLEKIVSDLLKAGLPK